MAKHVWAILGCAAILGCGEARLEPSGQEGAIPAEPAIGFEALTAFDRLPLLADGRAHQDSSYSRAHENADSGNYLRVEKSGEKVMVDAAGPGVIYRIWSTGATATEHAHPKVRFKFYFDGEAQPRLDLSMRELFGEHGATWPFVPPLSRTFQSGYLGMLEGPASICYVPIPFAEHVKITTNAAQFYHVGYITYPPGTPIESFSMALAEKNRRVLDRAAAMFLARGQMPCPPPGPMAAAERGVRVQPGKTALLYEARGAGVVRALKVKLLHATQENLRGLVLQIQYDGSGVASVNAPIGDFFGAAGGDLRYRSLPMGATEAGYYCYFPMPYRKGVRLQVRNDTARAATLLASVAVHRAPALPVRAGYFHAAYQQDRNIKKHVDYNILAVRDGRGKFVGCNVLMQSAQGQGGVNFLEGDEAIYVDEETTWPPRWVGTGTEDYFNGSYYWNAINPEDKDQPYGGITLRDNWLRRVSAYRWHVTDFVSFRERCRVDLQHGPKSDWPCDYASVGYWYMDRPMAAPKLPPMAQRRVRNEILGGPVMIGCEFVGPFTSEGKPLQVVSQPGSKEAPGNTIQIGVGMPYRQHYCRATKIDQEITGTLRVPGMDRYRLTAYLATGPTYGKVGVYADKRLLRNINTFSTSYHPVRAFDLGLHNLAGGEHKLTFKMIGPDVGGIEGGMDLGIVAFHCVPTTASAVRTWQVIGPFPCPKEGGWEASYPPEAEQKLDAVYDVTFRQGGKEVKRKVKWRAVELRPGAGVAPQAYYGQLPWACCYGLTYIWSPKDQGAGAFLAKDDALKIWVNGKQVFDNRTWSHYVADRHIATLPLKKGWNAVLVKSGNWDGCWAYAIRVSDPDRQLRFSNVTPATLVPPAR